MLAELQQLDTNAIRIAAVHEPDAERRQEREGAGVHGTTATRQFGHGCFQALDIEGQMGKSELVEWSPFAWPERFGRAQLQ